MGIKAIMQTEHLCLTYGPDRKQVTKKSELRAIYRMVFLWGLALKPFDKVICVSKHVRKQFETVFDNYKHYETIYLGVSEARRLSDNEKKALREELHITDDAQVITTTAFAVWLKGGDVLVNALQYLKDKNYVAVIIGFDESVPFTQELHRLAESTGVAEKIRWIGITNEVYKYLSISDIYVQPSRTEALPLAVCEAMSYGLPCVGSNAGGLPEVCNVLFETGNSRELAEELDTLMTDPALRAKLGSESKKAFEEKFKLQRGVEAYHRLYAETLARKEKKRKE